MKKISIDVIFYCIYIIIYVIVVSLYGFGNSISNLRYYVLFFLCILAALVYMISKKGKNKFICKENLFSIIVGIVFLTFSIIKAKNVGMSVPFRTIVQISLFLLPTLYAFYVVNFISSVNIIRMMKMTTFILIIGYFCEKSYKLLALLNINNWLHMQIFNFTESANWAESFFQLFLFFYYIYHKDKIKNKNLKFYYIISLIFTILCFKRLSVLFSFLVLFFGDKIIKKGDFKKNHKILITILFTISTIIYTLFMKGYIFDYDTVFKLTTGRNWILKMWEFTGYLSYGYGSSMLIIGRYLEMDLIEIYMELNIISLILFIYCYFNICKKNIYSNFIMVYVFLNMLTASSLPWQISWVVMMININYISNYNEKILMEKGAKKNE